MDKNAIVDVEVAQNGNPNELLQQEHYYPFGMGIKGEWKFVQPQIGGTNKYQYNGIELNDDFGLNWNMAMFRTYDASIGRWGQVDPLASLFLNKSPYSGMGNNPINFSDRLGLAPIGLEGREDGRVPKEKKSNPAIIGDGKGGSAPTYRGENSDWIPSVGINGKIVLTAEEGDNVNSLIDFFGSKGKAETYINSSNLNKYITYSKGDKVSFNSTTKFSKTMKFYQDNIGTFKKSESYDCQDLCNVLVLRNQAIEQVESAGSIGTPNERQAWGYSWSSKEEIKRSDREFGTTFAYWGAIFQHAAVSFGTDRQGNEYFFSKNGYSKNSPLVIMSSSELSKVYYLWYRGDYKSRYAE
jgi:RHS repeat-associated protein